MMARACRAEAGEGGKDAKLTKGKFRVRVAERRMEISQIRSVWLLWANNFVLKGRWKFPGRIIP
jgi:hypothetical protein